MMKKASKIIALLLASLMVATGLCTPLLTVSAATGDVVAYQPPLINAHEGGYDTHDRTLVTHAFDFSVESVNYYATDPAVVIDNRTAAQIVNGGLTTKEGKTSSFGSSVCLGDNYGLEDGYLSFDLCLTGGSVTLGLRTSRPACTTETRGVWFVFDGSDKLKIYEPVSGLEATVAFPYDLSEAKTFNVHDSLDAITLSCGDSVVASISYRQDGYLAILNAEGSTVAETNKSDVYVTGYFQLTMETLEGYIDNVVFTNVEVEQSNPEADTLRPIDYSTWTATDDLERTVADAKNAGEPNPNRYVGVFYFLCWVGAGIHVQDNTKLYLEGGMDGVLEHFNNRRGGEAYWAEPYFGYYVNTDTWVYRKHAYMLEQAGVDFIYLDVSNREVFIDGHTALFDTWLQMRKEGIDTPQIVFFNGDTPDTFQSNMSTLFTTVYSEDNWEKYEELFFMWDGKPLVFGNASGLSGNTKTSVEEKFTVRGSWAWSNKDNYWSWLQEYVYKNGQTRLENGGWGRDANGKKESLSVALGHHATTSKGRSYVNRIQPNNGLGDFEYSSIERAGLGLCFESQFNAVMKLIEKSVPETDPFVMMITGWNEWIAGCSYTEEGVKQPFCNSATNFFYVDNFNAEFSRDAEPMRNTDGYGFGDNYYYQMVDYIRKFKGMNQTPVADHQGTVNIYDVSTFDGISQTYMDSLYDVELRNTRSYDLDNRYINNTGRNDFDYAKVSQDDNNLYFLVKCTNDIIIDNGKNWMNLYIDTDGNAATGWEGYDYVINRNRDSYVVTVEKFKEGSFESTVVGGAYYALSGEYMTVRLPKALLGVEGLCEKLIFKWADNSVENGDPMGFMDLGDAAPDNRFGFVYLCESVTTTEETPVMFVPGELTAPANGVTVSGPAENIEITVKDSAVDAVFDFENEKSGTSAVGTAISERFEFLAGTNISTCKYKKTARGIVARLAGFTDLRTWNELEGDYTFSVDYRMAEDCTNTFFVRGEMPGALAPENHAHTGDPQTFNYYEWDWYAENGGRQGGSSVGGSGIAIIPGTNAVQVLVKRYAADGLTVTASSLTLPYPDGFEIPANGWVTFSCEDNGEEINFYFNKIPFCTAVLEKPGVVYESDGTGQAYYGNCTIVTPDGRERLSVTNTRVNSVGSQVALTTRNQNLEFDNVCIAYHDISAEGGRIEQPLTVNTSKYLAADELRLVLELVSDVPTTEYVAPPEGGGEQDTKTEEELTANAPEDTAGDGETTDQSSDTSNGTVAEGDTSEDEKSGCVSAMLPGAAIVTVIAAAALFRKKKEE